MSMNCDLSRPQIDAYIDGELAADQLAAMDSHLRSCAACAAEAASSARLKAMTRAAGQQFSPTPEFRRRIREQMAPRPSALRWWRWAPASALALAVFLIAAVLVPFSLRRSRWDQTRSELADLHVTTLASSAPVDVVSTDRHTVKPWFQGKVPFTFDLPDLTDPAFALVGGRVTYVQQAPAAQLLFRIHSHHASVFIVQDRGDFSGLPGSASGSELSFRVRTWTQSGLRYFLISDASPDDVQRLCQWIQNAGRS